MKALPIYEDFEKEETETDIAKKLLHNIEKIKNLESDNKNLQKILVNNQNLIKKDYSTKIDTLISLIHKKDLEFRHLRQQLKQDYNTFVQKFNEKLTDEKKKNLILIKKFDSSLKNLKGYQLENKALKANNIKIKYLLKKEYEKKLHDVSKDYRLHQSKTKHLIKKHESDKLTLNEQIEYSKQKIKFLEDKYKNIIDRFEISEKNNHELKDINKKLFSKIKYLEDKTIANQNELETRFNILKQKFEEKIKDTTKNFIDKEIEYKTTIDSLNKDLKKYIIESHNTKKLFYDKEKELKRKIENIVNSMNNFK
jgi:hypothetical protein